MSDSTRLKEKQKRKKELLLSLSSVKGKLFEDDDKNNNKNRFIKNAKNDNDITPKCTSLFNILFGLIIGAFIACVYLVVNDTNISISNNKTNNSTNSNNNIPTDNLRGYDKTNSKSNQKKEIQINKEIIIPNLAPNPVPLSHIPIQNNPIPIQNNPIPVATNPIPNIKKGKGFLKPKSKNIDGTDKKYCPYDFSVFVYNIPPSIGSITVSENARKTKTLHVCQKCILEQFALEYIIFDFFNNFCGRTYDPDKADYFYLPIVRDAEYRSLLESPEKGIDKRKSSETEQALLDIMEKNDSKLWNRIFNITDKYWYRNGGGDHIIAMPAPVTNLRHEGSRRGFFHYMMHLHPPIFLALEYSKSFVNEYPVCTKQKNILVPYPTTDPDLFSGNFHKGVVNRTSLLYYVGGMHGECIEVRRAMKFIMINMTRVPNIVPSGIHANMADREKGFRASVFCPVPVGDSPSSKRMYDVMYFGCIPVILSDDLLWAFSKRVGGSLDESLYSIQMPQFIVQSTTNSLLKKYENFKEKLGVLPSGTMIYNLLLKAKAENAEYQNGQYINPLVQILQRVSAHDIEILRSGVEGSAPMFRYYKMKKEMNEIPTSKHSYPDGGAIEMITHLLSEKKGKGILNIKNKCQEERKKKHNYIGKYPCEAQ